MSNDHSHDFFISYNKADTSWAEWIAWELEESKYSTVLQAWDFRPGNRFVEEMDNAAKDARITIAVLSPHYLNADFTQPEWQAAFDQDPTGKKRIFIPVRVKECEVEGLLKGIIYIDLVDVEEEEATRRLLEGVRPDNRVKPNTPPDFPGTENKRWADKPPYPRNKSTLPSKTPVKTIRFRKPINIENLEVLFQEIYHPLGIKQANCKITPPPDIKTQQHAFDTTGFFEYIKTNGISNFVFTFFEKKNIDRNIEVTASESRTEFKISLESKYDSFLNDKIRVNLGQWIYHKSDVSDKNGYNRAAELFRSSFTDSVQQLKDGRNDAYAIIRQDLDNQQRALHELTFLLK